MTHLALDVTPAKLLARVILLRAYDYLTALLDKESWDPEIWYGLDEMNARLSTIGRAIVLSEELIAIADSFHIATTIFKNQYPRTLASLEEKSVEKYQKLSRDFGEMYYNTFKRVVGWCYEERLMQLLGMFLQGIRQNRYKRADEVVDSNRRCKNLAEKAKGMKTAAELKDYLNRTIEADGSESWKGALARLEDHSKLNIEGLWLWTLMQGRKSRKVHVILLAQESDRGWFIRPYFASSKDSFDKSPHSMENAAIGPLQVESFRQQLDEGKGIYCPYYTPGECNCEPFCRESLRHILQWAREVNSAPVAHGETCRRNVTQASRRM